MTNSIIYLTLQICQTSRIVKLNFQKSRLLQVKQNRLSIFSYPRFTTVHRYGDKTPRSIPGRLFGFVWIIAGVVMISIFTATLTTAFTENNGVEMRGLNVHKIIFYEISCSFVFGRFVWWFCLVQTTLLS